MNSRTRLLADVLRAEVAGLDIQEDVERRRILICAMSNDGALYELGEVSIAAALQDPDFFRYAVNKIKFARVKMIVQAHEIEGEAK